MGLASSSTQDGASGCCSPKDERVEQALSRAQSRLGTVSISGRYHRLPKHLETDYEIGKTVLGSGYNGDVFMATRKGIAPAGDTQKTRFAIKEFKLRNIPENKRSELEQECEVYLGMDHPHVARLVDVYEEQDRLSLVMECMEGGELFDRVIEKKKFSEKDALGAAYQMTLAINYLHSHKIVHRDIKLENWLYDKKDSDHLKLIDFGFSKAWEPNIKMKASCGTLSYVAPEVLNKSYGPLCDMWSLGVVIFILLGGYMPFSGPDETQQANIKAGKYRFKEEKWRGISANAVDFVKKLMVVDVEARLTAQQALEHPWMVNRAHLADNVEVNDDVAHGLIEYAQESKFRRACMLAMAWSLSNEERAKVRQAFLDMDKNHRGTITLGEFKQVMVEKFHLNDKQVLQAFSALDTAHHQEIEYSVFLAAMVSKRIALHDDLLHEAFRRFDVDNTGSIDAANLKEVFGQDMSDAELQELMNEVDENHDGKISYAEFIHYVREHDAKETHQELCHNVIDQELQKNSGTGSKRASEVRKERRDSLGQARQDAMLKAR